MLVKLTDPAKIAWDKEQGVVITGKKSVRVRATPFIKSKIKEGVLVEVPEEPEPLSRHTVDELRKMAREKGIDPVGMKKDNLIAALKEG